MAAALWLAAAGAATLYVTPVIAQTEPEARAMAFDIPAQPLADALMRFGQQSGMQVSADNEAIRNVRSNAVAGTFSPAEALRRMLEGTGVPYRLTGANAVTIGRTAAGPNSDGVVTLAPVTVEGRAESAYGPVDGYVATRSATGTKMDTPIIETPQSISVVTRDQMDAQAVQNVDQSLRYTAGVVTETAGADNRFDIVSGRGFGLDEYLDGMKFLSSSAGFAVPQVDPYSLERVEVLRGPASVLYGQGGPGGVVNLVTKRPTDTPLHEVQLQAGSFDERQGAFDIGGPLDEEGRFLYRLTGLARESGTQVDHTEYERYFIAPSLTWRPTDDTDITLLISHQADPKAGFFNKLPAQGTALSNPAGQIPTNFYAGDPGFDKFDRKMTSAGYLLEHRFSNAWTVRQNLRYLHMDSDFAAIFAGATLQPDGHTINRQVFTSLEGLDAFTMDNQVQSRFATGDLKHTALFGVDYQWRRWDQVGRFGLGPSIDFLNPIYDQTITLPGVFADQVQKQEQIGFYAQDQVKLGGWSLLLGGRWDKAESDTENQLTGTTTDQSDDAFTGRVGLTYQFENGFVPYLSYAESFEPAAGTDFAGRPFEPTTGRQYEIGVKYQPSGTNSLITLSAFDLTQQNVLTSDPAHTGFNVQTGEIRSRGVELEGKAALTDNFSVLASYAYVDAEVTKANDGTEGNRPVSVPAHLASAWADYTFDAGPLSGFGIGGGIRFLGSSFGNTANTFEIDDATLFDATIRYDIGALIPSLSGLQLAVNATNLFDKEYVGRCQNNGCYYGLRRTVFATLKYRW